MSEDASPTGGRQTPPPLGQDTATDQNDSLIEKVRSRVGKMIPFSKWFSPTTSGALSPISGDQGSRNGGVRRWRDDTVIGEQTVCQDPGDLEDSEAEDLDEEEDIAPPTKRSRLNVAEDHSPIDFPISNAKIVDLLSSTPTSGVGSRKHLGLKSINQPLHSTISNITTTRSVTTKSIVSRSIPERGAIEDDDAGNADDVFEVIPENINVNNPLPQPWDTVNRSSISGRSSGIRELKLPTRRRSIRTVRDYASLRPSMHYSLFDPTQDEDDIAYEGQSPPKILTNGIRPSPNPLSVDTASESGESQTSSVQKAKLSEGLHRSGVKRFRNSASSGLNYVAHLQGKKSLFGDKNMPSHLNNSTTSLTSLNRRQSFNASLYGSTSALSDSRLLNTYSPFYKGYTTFGGASAYSKYSQNARRINPTPTLIRPSSSLSTASSTPSLANTHDSSTTISNTAKRILELMNQFTTPLADVKKMANNTKVPALTAHRQRFGDADRSINRGIRMTVPKTPYSRPSVAQPNQCRDQPGPPLTELHVPSMSQLLQMKKLQSNTERAREITRTNQSKLSIATENESTEREYRLPPTATSESYEKGATSSTKHVNKIKNKLTSTRSSAKDIEKESSTPAVVLPDIPLPLKDSAVPKLDINIVKPFEVPTVGLSSTPKVTRTTEQSNGKVSLSVFENKDVTKPKPVSSAFTFGSSTNKSSELKQPAKEPANGSSTAQAKKSEKLANGGQEFTFSVPIEVTSPSLPLTDTVPASNFKFSEPVPVETSLKLSDNFGYQSSGTCNKPKPIATTPQANIPAVATQLKTSGSVLDAFKKPTPAEATSTSVSSSSVPFGAQFKMTSDKWECSICMVRNEKTVDKCVSCSNSRKAAEPAKVTFDAAPVNKIVSGPETVKPAEPLKNSFGDKFKPSADTWECSACFVRNKKDVSKCVACNTEKPGGKPSVSVPAAAPSLVSSSSSVPNKLSDSSFKSIVASQSAKWECSACMTRNEPARNKCACCEQAKPGTVSDSVPEFSFGTSASTAASKFTFGFAAKSETELKSDSNSQVKTSGEVKQSFSFGVPSTAAAPAPAAAATSFSFGFKPASSTASSAASSGANKDEPDKPAAPKFSFGNVSQPATTESPKASNAPEKSLGTIAKTESSNTATTSSLFKFGTSTSAFSSSTFTATSSSKESDSKTPATSGATSSTSIFKPIGSMAFSPSTEKKASEPVKTTTINFGSSTSTSKAVTTEAKSAPTGIGSFTSLAGGSQQKVETTSSTESSNSGGSKLFSFGVASATKPAESNSATETKPATGFSFGSPSSITGTSVFKSPLTQKTDLTSSAATSGTSSSATFVFGKPSTPASVTPTFGAISSNVITSSNPTGPVSTSAPSFGGLSSSAVTPSTASSFQTPATQPLVSASAFGGNATGATISSLFGSNSFSSASSSSGATENKNAVGNLFQFGSGNKPADTATTAATPSFGNVSSTTSGRFSFGSSNSIPTAAPAQAATPFVFGGASSTEKANESAGSSLFGSAAAAAPNRAVAAPTLPAFGSFSSPLQQSQQQPQQPPQQTQTPLFGQSSTLSSPFGSNLTSNNTATFGSAPAAAPAAPVVPFGSSGTSFGASGTSAFGSPAAKQPLFGNGFGSTPAQSSDEPPSKKSSGAFNFGAPAQAPSSGFSFGASNMNSINNNNNKQPFTFTASTTPSFNFTGSSETASNAPFQFNAASAANNIFAATPTPSSAQSIQRRKGRIVTKRTQR
ncbi:unnamed protein product [Hermetia illucens]|uniref:Nuclear pore complex protein Nup153 n=1 Tax=Hermetia illucens TaxID=343691 RepID=A0A7R8UZW9_HERIL|nr:nuclear pore complex protein Nup153 isoform X3 [Hermetia illucens]CAD7090013.1 unnamed protein product [Hermetia illucens]